MEEPAFIADKASDFLVHTRWIETELETVIEPWDGAIEEGFDAEELYRTVVVEVEGRRLKVGVPSGIFAAGQRATLGKAPKRAVTGASAVGASEGQITSPMQATVVKVLAKVGDVIAAGDGLCVLEAMKMEQLISAPISGVVSEFFVFEGQAIAPNGLIATIDVSNQK